MSTSSVRHFGTEIDMDLRFFALVHKYSLVLDSIRIEKVIFFSFFWGGPPLRSRDFTADQRKKGAVALIYFAI